MPEVDAPALAQKLYAAHNEYHGHKPRWEDEPWQSRHSWLNIAKAAIAALQSSQPRDEGPDISDVLETARQRTLVLFQAYVLGVSMEYKRDTDQFIHDVKTFDAELKDALAYPIFAPPIEQENTEERPAEKIMRGLRDALNHAEAQPRSPVEDALDRVREAITLGHSDQARYCLNDDSWFHDSQTGRAIYVRDLRLIVEALAQSPAIDPRVEELVEAARGARHLACLLASLLASEMPTTAQAQDKITRLDAALAAFGGKADSPKPDQLSDKEG